MLNILRSALRHDADPAAAGAAGARCDEAACFGMQVHNLTIRAKGKALLESTVLTVSQGRRYGLVGPNGKGKSTLLRMVARRQVPVPDSLDVLLVEQVRRCDCAQSAAPRPACRAACWAGQPTPLWHLWHAAAQGKGNACAAVQLRAAGVLVPEILYALPLESRGMAPNGAS